MTQPAPMILAVTPEGSPDPAIAIAASRHGGKGVLSLEYCVDTAAAAHSLEKLSRLARNPFGVKVHTDDRALLRQVISAGYGGLDTIVLAGGAQPRLAQAASECKAAGLGVIVEAVDLEEALQADAVHADAVIAKGNEAGGRVGEETAFVLLQRVAGAVDIPVLVHGGIGVHTAAAALAAGASGFVLDAQLLLSRESPLPRAVRDRIASMDGSETACVGDPGAQQYRFYSYPGHPAAARLPVGAAAYANANENPAEAGLRDRVRESVGWDSVSERLLLIGQDAGFARSLAKEHRSVAGIIKAIRDQAAEHLSAARRLHPLAEGAPLAESHGTRYPVVQGPMTRVSDVPAFAASVADNGALPFLALALMRGQQVSRLLEETRSAVGDRPWGVGILGFVPTALRREQMEAIRAYRPPFALIAGGRPDQAKILESEGIPTYLHVPSPGLLELFVKDGARRFVFEGRECGGHVGPRSSFVLWESMVSILLDAIDQGQDAESYHVLFAGGIHDAVSSAAVAALAAPLAERGVKVGVLMGTGYIFTEEAVASGAITRGYQQEALACSGTVLLETGAGHATRVANTPFVDTFRRRKQELVASGLSGEELRDALEDLNIGRLRIATKGVDRNPRYGEDEGAPEFLSLTDEQQRQDGTYMIGQAAAVRPRVSTMAEFHQDVCIKGDARLQELADNQEARAETSPEKPFDIAIVGMSAIMPGAQDVQAFWENILNKVDSVREVPDERWDTRDYFDPEGTRPDSTGSKWGGFLDDVPFDPFTYGIPPRSMTSIEPMQLLALETTRRAIEDAGYEEGGFDRERTSVIFGAGGGSGDLTVGYIFRSALPGKFGDTAAEISEELGGAIPEWTEDSFAGILVNVAAGRVANRMNFGGVNCTVDAACASSLASVYMAARELESGSCDVAIAGGIDALQNPFAYVCFDSAGALSPTGRCRPYDSSGDGIAISEGFAALMLKRREDAERDGDQIYAVIRGVAGSSDGRGAGLTAPLPSGQERALERAYAKSNVSPADVGLIEGHGTGTVVGDRTEITSLTGFFTKHGAEAQNCALGSVKSNIGHTKCTAGVAGMIKVALSLHHKVLPPTLNVAEPNPGIKQSGTPLYVNTEARPWIQSADRPRYGGVSAFGFGGTNFHAVLEEYTGAVTERGKAAPKVNWESELFVWKGGSRGEVLAAMSRTEDALAAGSRPRLPDLAAALAAEASTHEGDSLCLAVVASSLDDLGYKLAQAREEIAGGARSVNDSEGIYYTEEPLARSGRIAFLFPGQGSQYTGMLKDATVAFPEVAERFEKASSLLAPALPERLYRLVFPPPAFSREEEKRDSAALTSTNVAQPALGAADLGMLELLRELGLQPAMAAGHSYGEFVALCAAGVFSEDDLYAISKARGRFMLEASGENAGTMAAVEAGRETVEETTAGVSGTLVISNLNSPSQTVISGEGAAIDEAVRVLEAKGISARRIAVACAFHSPLVAGAQERLSQFLSDVAFASPSFPVFSNSTGAEYPRDPEDMKELLARHLASPVKFVDEVRAMYDAGARVFVEVGPRSTLTRFAAETLEDQQVLTLATDRPGRSGMEQLLDTLAQLCAHGAELDLARLFRGRVTRELDLSRLSRERAETELPAHIWMVNGGRAVPAGKEHEWKIAARHKARVALLGPDGVPGGQASTAGYEPASSASNGNGASSGNGRSGQRNGPTQGAAVGNGAPRTNHDGWSAPSPGTRGQVFQGFQQVMRNFLDTQESVMRAYLEDGKQPAPHPETPAANGSENGGASGHGGETAGADVSPEPRRNDGVDVSQANDRSHGHGTHLASEPSNLGTTGRDSSSAGSEFVDESQVMRRLLAIVSERTGYPQEMLDPAVDLEAELGIDSIKRVEIVGELKQALGEEMPSGVDPELLSQRRTLEGIVGVISGRAGGNGRAAAGNGHVAPGHAPEGSNGSGDFRVARHVLRLNELPPPAANRNLSRGKPILVVGARGSVSAALARSLSGRGCDVVSVSHAREFEQISAAAFCGDLTSPEDVERIVTAVRDSHGQVAGLVSLLPLETARSFGDLTFDEWGNVLALDGRALYIMARALGPDLRDTPGSFIVTVGGMGGSFGVEASGPATSPAGAAATGLAKTLSQEWPEVEIKAMDVDALESPDEIADHSLAEIMAMDGVVEVGYSDGKRQTIKTVEEALDVATSSRLSMDSSSVVLVVGGARGITAEAAIEMAERWQPSLLLAGRTAYQAAEDAATAGISDTRELKSAIMSAMRAEGKTPTPAEVERTHMRLLREREVRENISRMEEAGARVHYYQVDSTDDAAFGEFVRSLYSRHGRLDGVVHGVGVIEDKLVEDKTPESFDRVFGAKTKSAFTLVRSIDTESLKFLVFFSSVSARFGNRGQGDYAAANEVLNKLAGYLDCRWPGRVVAINWGPWRTTGMVSDVVEKQFQERGVQLIGIPQGRRMFAKELLYGRKGDPEVVVGGWLDRSFREPSRQTEEARPGVMAAEAESG